MSNIQDKWFTFMHNSRTVYGKLKPHDTRVDGGWLLTNEPNLNGDQCSDRQGFLYSWYVSSFNLSELTKYFGKDFQFIAENEL